ncbi:NUDIX hydrolase [Pontibacillus halophilus JSM 076056 = DSM 19796]|uniref:NUDIX hydrolase n=1 Tax=Pontibacillus halophilus JSM 076056 = DSM 19796 TaxID=1385510 RepID=A0A0A5IC51_9BACI|nr:CoA pyrophosphatase [Pontibacillus halophilus]KGX93417.1 NUDIX hydrolase [Pontibacillus halophilus JSM 076056 = DSM 19796]
MKKQTIQDTLKQHTPTIIGDDALRTYSLLLPLVEREDGLHLLFEVRSYHMRRQPGEICFPGGKYDPEDQGTKETAIREAVEELGIKPGDVRDVYELGYMVSPFGMKVEAYIGLLTCEEEELLPNPDEVAEVFTVPLDYFLDNNPVKHYVNLEVTPEASFPFHLIENGDQYSWPRRKYPEFFYEYDGRVIWGLTARVLYDFIRTIR